MEFAIIGGGNMGRAIAFALVEKGVCPPERLIVVDPDPGCRDKLAALGCALAEAADERVGRAEVVVLAVKPQVAGEVMAGLRPLLRKGSAAGGQVVLSIMAGISLETIRARVGSDALVRAMPNTPAQIGLGMNVYHPTAAVPAGGLTRVEALFRACGEAMRVESEDAIDAATAISGSGPAYVFYFAEQWIAAAESLGFTTAEATKLVQQTITGATELWKRQDLPASTLREQVTSKGGTTAAALEHFQAEKLGEILRQGISWAYRRAKELAQ